MYDISRLWWFNICRQSNSATIEADVFDTIWPEVSALAQQLDDIVDE